ncbi:hypothetical protein ACQEWB_00525 [Streptomyces sp. CA-249302]|uniref:hypothetical protein n=1 Tax=Streptomyces sp. CA-249302 TaxID=3240058 RepID=UPI003D8AF9EE
MEASQAIPTTRDWRVVMLLRSVGRADVHQLVERVRSEIAVWGQDLAATGTEVIVGYAGGPDERGPHEGIPESDYDVAAEAVLPGRPDTTTVTKAVVAFVQQLAPLLSAEGSMVAVAREKLFDDRRTRLKYLHPLVRQPHLTHAEFIENWEKNVGPVVAAHHPTRVGYVALQCDDELTTAATEACGFGGGVPDGFGVEWFASTHDMIPAFEWAVSPGSADGGPEPEPAGLLALLGRYADLSAPTAILGIEPNPTH